MTMLKFYIPFIYTLETRFESRTKRIAWCFTYFIPVALTFFLIYYNIYQHISVESIAVFLLGILTIYNTYEIGYIENDTELVKHEKNPTMRLNNSDLSYYEENKIQIYSLRIFLTIIILASLQIIQSNDSIEFAVAIFSLLVIFIIYNSTRSRLNLLLQFFLSSSRYLSVCLLILQPSNYSSFLIFVFIFPVINFIEWTTKERFKIKRLIKYHDRIYLIRVIYYTELFVIGYLCFTNNQFYIEYLTVMFYMLAYRTIVFYKSN
jgi:hypothetical protein